MKDHRKERAEARKSRKTGITDDASGEGFPVKIRCCSRERLGVPAYNYWNEALHGVARAGVATMFPQAIAMAAVFDDEEMKKLAISLQLREEQNTMHILQKKTEIFTRVLLSGPQCKHFQRSEMGQRA